MRLSENTQARNSGDGHESRSALTPRQKEVAGILSRTGLSYKQVASQLAISEGTMRKHTENVYRKLGVHSRAELVVVMRERQRN
ncbi:MAG TPA: LuxR C-terminal-related transcriptional regulator [Polyangium sp.]|nr:LuxR C-terminal-related transcriptional regulator [Polyangium sp.]